LFWPVILKQKNLPDLTSPSSSDFSGDAILAAAAAALTFLGVLKADCDDGIAGAGMRAEGAAAAGITADGAAGIGSDWKCKKDKMYLATL
jgi:hypothetical protein